MSDLPAVFGLRACLTCESYVGGSQLGDCRRNAPVVRPASVFGVFPKVDSDWWCMEWSPKMPAREEGA